MRDQRRLIEKILIPKRWAPNKTHLSLPQIVFWLSRISLKPKISILSKQCDLVIHINKVRWLVWLFLLKNTILPRFCLPGVEKNSGSDHLGQVQIQIIQSHEIYYEKSTFNLPNQFAWERDFLALLKLPQWYNPKINWLKLWVNLHFCVFFVLYYGHLSISDKNDIENEHFLHFENKFGLMFSVL